MLSRIISRTLNRIKGSKISVKLTIVYVFMFSIVLLLLNVSILYGVRFYLYNEANKQIDDIQRAILNKITAEDNGGDLANSEVLSDVPSNESIIVKILKEDGSVINSSDQFDYRMKGPQNKLKKHGYKSQSIEDKEGELIYRNIKFQSKNYNGVNIEIIKDLRSEYDFMKILVVVMGAADIIGLIVSVILGYMVSKKMLKPIDHITKTAENISINNLKGRIEVKEGPEDELKRLANTFNMMIDRLQSAFDRQVQFVSDASHELRTPIAVIQGYANLLDRWGKDDREALEKSIYAIKLESANMASLVEKLLFLAKGDSGTQLIEKKEFYLNELINEVVDESRLIDHNHNIISSRNDTVKILADYKMIKQMIRVFIDNSIKFTPDSGEIDVRSEIYNNTVKISVEDTGIGIPKDEIQNIFNRFHIVDKSRSKEKGGTGLGLSIAKWIIDMHKGTVEVESSEGKGTKMTVLLNLT